MFKFMFILLKFEAIYKIYRIKIIAIKNILFFLIFYKLLGFLILHYVIQ